MLRCMRTTLTIDDDVAVRLAKLREARRASLKDIVNATLREGLEHIERSVRPPREPYRVRPIDIQPLVANLDNIAEVLAWAEGDAHR